MLDLFIFFAGLAAITALILRVCEEGDYDDYD